MLYKILYKITLFKVLYKIILFVLIKINNLTQNFDLKNRKSGSK